MFNLYDFCSRLFSIRSLISKKSIHTRDHLVSAYSMAIERISIRPREPSKVLPTPASTLVMSSTLKPFRGILESSCATLANVLRKTRCLKDEVPLTHLNVRRMRIMLAFVDAMVLKVGRHDVLLILLHHENGVVDVLRFPTLRNNLGIWYSRDSQLLII